MKSLLFYFSLAFIILGCKKNTVEPNIDHSSKYQPLALGHTWIYSVDSIAFYGNKTQKPDTFQYQVRQQITETFTNNEGLEAFLVGQSYKSDSASKWTFSNYFTLSKDVTSLFYTYQDASTVTLSFPLNMEKEWNGNQYNTEDEIECYYESVHVPMSTSTANYDSTSTVFREQEINQITSKFERETYAANIGLISKKYEFLTGLDNENPDPKGRKLTYTLLRFEK